MIRPSALGDVCRTVPCLVSLRRAYPNAAIDWLVNDAFVPAVADHPGLTAVVPFDRGAFGKGLGRLKLSAARALANDLKARGYDLVIDLQGLARSGLLTWATRAARRVGYANAREMGWVGYNERYHVPRSMHAVDRMMRLIELAGVRPVLDMRLYSSEAGRAEVPESLRGTRYAVIAPTSKWAGKCWPMERFAALVPKVLGMGFDAVVVVGSRGEREQCGPVSDLAVKEPRVVDLLGATSVAGLMAVIEGSSLVVANDSAALHMAVGFDRPLVALFGPTRVELVGPYRRGADVLQHVEPGDRFAHKDTAAGRAMMERIGVDEVVGAVAKRCGIGR